MEFDPMQVSVGAAIGFVPALALFYHDGRRARRDRIRARDIAALDAAVGSLNKLLDGAAATLVSTDTNIVSGVLQHDSLGHFSADLNLIPAAGAIREFATLVSEVIADGRHRDDAAATQQRLFSLYVTIAASAREKRAELAE